MKKVNEDVTLPVVTKIQTFLNDTNPMNVISPSYSCVVTGREGNGKTEVKLMTTDFPDGVEFLYLTADEMGGVYAEGTPGSVKRVSHGGSVNYMYKFSRGGIDNRMDYQSSDANRFKR